MKPHQGLRMWLALAAYLHPAGAIVATIWPGSSQLSILKVQLHLPERMLSP